MPPNFGQAVYVVTPLLVSGQSKGDGPHFVMTPPVHLSQPGTPVKLSVTPCDDRGETTSSVIVFDGETVQCLPPTPRDIEKSTGTSVHGQQLGVPGSLGTSVLDSSSAWTCMDQDGTSIYEAGTTIPTSEQIDFHIQNAMKQSLLSTPVDGMPSYTIVHDSTVPKPTRSLPLDRIKMEALTDSGAPSKNNSKVEPCTTALLDENHKVTRKYVKRGRPRKNAVPLKIVSSWSEEEAKDTDKKYKVVRKYGKRGRPRKNAVPIKVQHFKRIVTESDEESSRKKKKVPTATLR